MVQNFCQCKQGLSHLNFIVKYFRAITSCRNEAASQVYANQRVIHASQVQPGAGAVRFQAGNFVHINIDCETKSLAFLRRKSKLINELHKIVLM